LRVSLTKTSWEFLYFPMTDQVKRKAKRFIDVVVNRSGDAVAGVLILILNFLLGGSLAQLTVVILGLALVWFLLELTTTQAYAKEVSSSLGRLVGDREEKRISLQDITDATEMTGLLESSNQAQVLYALDVLESMDPEVVRAHSSGLLEHPSQAVRARTLAILALQGEDIELYEFKAELPGSDLSGEDAVKVYEETAADRVAIAASAGRVVDSEDQEERLIDLMGDEDQDVRRTAYRSAGLSRRRSFVPHLVNRLSIPEERARVRDALVLYGERTVGMMGDYLQDPETPISVKTQITTVLVEVGGQHAAYSLFRATSLEMDRRVVNEALRALNRIQGDNPAVRIPRELMLRDLRQEIDRYCRRIVQERSVRSAADPNLATFIQRVLNERAEQSLERIFRRVALVYDTNQTLAAYRGYRSDNARLRAQAIEYLDTSLPSDIKNLILPVLEAPSEEEQVQKASLVLASDPPTLMGTLEEFLESRESWLNTCGLYVIGCRKFKDYRARVETFSNSQDPIIRETAGWALKQLEASEEAK
jgi:HEAT repeat protein